MWMPSFTAAKPCGFIVTLYTLPAERGPGVERGSTLSGPKVKP